MQVLSKDFKYDQGYIVHADIKLKNMPPSVTVNDQKLVMKNEFHITTVAANRIANLIGPNNADMVEAEIVELFKRFIARNGISSFSLLKDFRFLTKDIRRTVVVMCVVPGGDKFFELLSQEYKTQIPVQPFHITIYSLKKDVGASISSDKELKEITTSVDLPELANIAVA